MGEGERQGLCHVDGCTGLKADLIARKANHSASHILFRLYTTYQPGGTGERNLVLSKLQHPQVTHDATGLLHLGIGEGGTNGA